jgi:HAD superfamily hydrolase (TIGR01458 family)
MIPIFTLTAMLLLIDLDGTVHDRGRPVAGAEQAIATLRDAGHVLRFTTNTDSRTPREIRERLAGYGVTVAEEELFTPVVAARRVLGAEPGAHALVLGSDAVADDLRAYGKASVTGAPGVTHVVVGDCGDRLTYALLDAAFRAVRGGARLLALQRGCYYRGADGDHLDTGAIVAAIEYAAETTARLLGKPSPDFVRLAAGDVDRSDVVVIGDDRTTDIAMARATGARSVQVRTGKYAAQADRVDLPEADQVVDSLAVVPGLLSVA